MEGDGGPEAEEEGEDAKFRGKLGQDNLREAAEDQVLVKKEPDEVPVAGTGGRGVPGIATSVYLAVTEGN